MVMDGIKNDDNENIVKELSEEEIETFERGEELDTFQSSGKTRSLDAHDGEESFETDFDDEMNYVSEMEEASQGFFSKIFRPSFLSAGVLGGLLVVLIVLFLFMPRGMDVADRKEVAQIEKRLAYIEEQIVDLKKALSARDGTDSAETKPDQTKERIDNLEKILAVETDRLKKEIDTLAAAVSDIRSGIATEKAAVEEPVKTQTVQYHTVKAGENLYRIAIRYGLKEDELLKLNGLKKNAIIHPGDKLRVSK